MLLFFSTLSFAQHQDYFPDPDTAIQRRLEVSEIRIADALVYLQPVDIVESWSICPEDLSWATGARKKGQSENYADCVKEYEALQTTFNP